jgi:hypothetical protein
VIAADPFAAPGPVGPPRSALGIIDELLRDRRAMIRRLRAGDGEAVLPIMRTLVVTIAVAMAAFGAVIGSYRGGNQIGYAAIKLPLVLLGTAALSAPALTAIGVALGRRARLASDLALVMAGLAFGALLLAACTPLIFLARTIDVPYHRMVLAVVVMAALAGVAALRVIVGAVAAEASPGGVTAVIGLCVVFAVVGGQLAWALRPYLVRPRASDVVFVHAVEGSLVDAIGDTIRSAGGHYTRTRAPLPGEHDRVPADESGGER